MNPINALKKWVADPVVTPMMVKAFIVTVLAAAIVIPLLLISVPYLDFFNDMAVQYKVKPQMAWYTEADGSTIPGDFQPVEGTLPRGYYPYPFIPTLPADVEAAKLVTKETTDRAGAALAAAGPDIAPPYRQPKPTTELLATGKKMFDTYCIVCHGEYGMGDGTVPTKGFPLPPSLLDQRARTLPDGGIFHIITTGQNAMPKYRNQLRPEERWGVVYYVRSLQKAFPAPPPAPELPAVAPELNAPVKQETKP
ncbi:MAG: hypothetical protein AUK47_15205 [Deltaproteobacteria bacterium CG2_30_63_29]|nr:MAG: hypothetical protein AUK47_15205 [Deltaproteobacteria bacterium CG2_30_63_29]